MVLRIIFNTSIEDYFFIVLIIIFRCIANLFFGLQYIAALRSRGLDRVFDFLGAHFENCATGRVFSKRKLRMPRRNIVRERNERGFYLFLQNLKGVLSLCESDEVFWTEDLIEETTKRLQDSYTTLTLIEHDWHDMSAQMNSPLPEHLGRLKSFVQSLHMVLVSCETVASSADNSVSFYPQPSPRAEGQGPGRLALNVTKSNK